MPTDNDFPAAPYTPRPTPDPGTIEFHVSAHTAGGSSVPEPWGDQDKYADCRTLPQAKEWAAKTMASDSRVHHCNIRESVKGPHGTGWTAGRHLQTVSRPPSPEALANLAQEVRTVGLQPAPLRALPPHLRSARRSGGRS